MTTRQRQADEQHSIRMAPYIAENLRTDIPRRSDIDGEGRLRGIHPCLRLRS